MHDTISGDIALNTLAELCFPEARPIVAAVIPDGGPGLTYQRLSAQIDSLQGAHPASDLTPG